MEEQAVTLKGEDLGCTVSEPWVQEPGRRHFHGLLIHACPRPGLVLEKH